VAGKGQRCSVACYATLRQCVQNMAALNVSESLVYHSWLCVYNPLDPTVDALVPLPPSTCCYLHTWAKRQVEIDSPRLDCVDETLATMLVRQFPPRLRQGKVERWGLILACILANKALQKAGKIVKTMLYSRKEKKFLNE